MPTPFPILSDAQYLTYLGPVSHRGGNPSTHLADIRYPVQSAPITSGVKLLDPAGLEACNEAIAWLFLRAAGVASPPNAALLLLTEEKAVKVLGRGRVQAKHVQQGYVVAWASSRLETKSIRAVFAGSESVDRLVNILKTARGAAIAAFDEMFLNLDRNAGNILFSGPDTIVAIDHEQISGHQDWSRGPLASVSSDGDSLRRLKAARDAGVLRLEEFEETMNRMAHAAEGYPAALDACQEDIEGLLSRVFPEGGAMAARRVLSFAAERTAEDWIKEKLGVV